MKFTPVGDRLFIKPSEAESTTKSGLVIPGAAQERVYRGEVISSASPRFLAGCRVVYSKYGGIELKMDGVTYIVVSERDVLGVVEDE